MLPGRRFPLGRLVATLVLSGSLLAGQEATTVVRLHREEPDYIFRFHPVYRAEGQRPFALALRGGIARGFTHLGVLQGLDDENLTADAIVGTSIGSLMGSLYASGFSAEGIARVFKGRDFGRVFDDRLREAGWSLSEDEAMHTTPDRLRFQDGKLDLVPGKTASRRVREALMPMLGRAVWLNEGDFDRLRIPFRAVASDLTAGGGKAFARGSLVDAVMASMCLPGAFEPVEIEGHQYMDGGPYENLPVQTSRREFPGMIQVGVAIGRPWDGKPKNNLVKLLDASLDLAMAQTEERSLAAADLIIRPAVVAASDFDFHRQVDALASEGRKAFDDRRAALEELIYGPEVHRKAASSMRPEAPGLSGAAEWCESNVPPGPVTFGHVYRILRKVLRDLPVSSAEVRLPPTPEGDATLVLVPAPVIERFEIDLPDDWPGDACRRIEAEFARRYGLAPGHPFDEGAWSQALEGLLVAGVLNQVPILDLRGSGFSPDGTLVLRLREPRITRISTRDRALQADFNRLFADLKTGPVRTTILAESISRTTARLGLSRLEPSIQEQNGVMALDLEATKASGIELAPQFGYESALGPRVALDAAFANFLHTGTRFQFHGVYDDREACLDGQWLDIFRPYPNIEYGFGGFLEKRWFARQVWTPVSKLRQGRLWGRIQTRFGAEERGLFQADLGRAEGSARTSTGMSPWNRTAYGRLALEWDSLDAHTLPTDGAMVRSAFTRAFHAEQGSPYTTAYLRARRLWRRREDSWHPGLDLDLEAGVQRNAPSARWFPLGGPESLIGTATESCLVPDFAVLRVGFPFTATSIFGLAVQTVPRFDVARISDDYLHLNDGFHVTGCGIAFRSVVRNFYVELAGGRTRARNASTHALVHDSHISFLIGARPFDLWQTQ